MMEKKDLTEKFHFLAGLVARLRGPGGCPWDAKQSDLSIKSHMLEEAYELADAVERGDPDEVRLELGDLLFQILFLTELASERGQFDLRDVIDGITAKMIRRHPHVFGSASVSCAEEVVDNWNKIKRAEKDGRGDQTSILRDVPRGLPALLRAHRLQQRAETGDDTPMGRGECWDSVSRAFLKLRRAVETVEPPVPEGTVEDVAGELLFAMAGLCRRLNLNAEEILQRANGRFIEGLETRLSTGSNG